MSRLLSTDFTYFYKVIVPGLGVIALVGAAVALDLARGSLIFSPAFLPLSFIIVGVAGYQIRVCVALKCVEMDARNLYISIPHTDRRPIARRGGRYRESLGPPPSGDHSLSATDGVWEQYCLRPRHVREVVQLPIAPCRQGAAPSGRQREAFTCR